MESLSLLSSFYGFYVCFKWEKWSHSFFTILAVTISSILQHFVNIIVYLGQVDEKYKFHVLWFDRSAAILSVVSKYKTVNYKKNFVVKKRILFSLLLLLLLDNGVFNDHYYDIIHSIWHILAFSLLDKGFC